MADNLELSAYSQRELKSLAKTFKLMGDDAVEESRKVAYEITNLAKSEIRKAGYTRYVSAGAVRRVVDGASISRTSKTGLLSIGFAGQRFSGGATTQKLWAGLEFGSKKFKQFPTWSGRYGGGSRGWFIYPSLRKIQPELTVMYFRAMNKAVARWSN